MNTPNYPARALLTEILAGQTEQLRQQWSETEAADEFGILPTGTYTCHVHRGELGTSQNGKPKYTITFRVCEGEYMGRQLWHPVYLTPAALPMAKRDLGKLGITTLEQLEMQVMSDCIRCAVDVVVRRDDDGAERNRIRMFKVICVDQPTVDPFAPVDGFPQNPTNAGAVGSPTTAPATPQPGAPVGEIPPMPGGAA